MFFLALFCLYCIVTIFASNHRRDREHMHNRTQDSLLLECLYYTNLKDSVWADKRLNLITTRTTRPFVMAVLPASLDRAVSEKLMNHGLWDPMILGPMQFILKKFPCDATSMVLDVGANIGFFGLFSLSMGCDTVMFEPQRHAAAAIRASLCVNEHVYRKKHLKSALFAQPVAKSSAVMFPTDYTLHGKNTGGVGRTDCNDPGAKCEEFKAVQLDEYWYGPMSAHSAGKQKIRVLKIDVEGFEGDVFDSMRGLLGKQVPENIIFELIPYKRGAAESKAIIKMLVDHNYTIAESPFAFLEGVRDIDRPYIKKVVPMNNEQAFAMIDEMQKMGENEKTRNNWKAPKHYTDIWATTSGAGIFEEYNAVVIPNA